MKKITSLFKNIMLAILCVITFFQFFYIYKNNTSKPSIKRDNDGIHRICRSNLEGKIAGKPCSMCRLKWSELKTPKNMQEKILRYAEKKFGKKVQDFTNGETKELFYMMSDMDTR
jgi:hypothetical protein